MIAKVAEKLQAIEFRKSGMSLRDIVKIVPVAKSTLSLWLKEVKLSKPQIQRLTQKKKDAALRGALKRKNDRIFQTNEIYKECEKDLLNLTKKDLWLMGLMLYWAEGQKQKNHNVACCVKFVNSDPVMVRLFVKWLLEICHISFDLLRFDVYIHETCPKTKDEVFQYWAKAVSIPSASIKSLYYKRGSKSTKRKNTGESYYGMFTVKVYRSTTLNRKIEGWIRAIAKYYWGMV